jgi:hypothetical protein
VVADSQIRGRKKSQVKKRCRTEPRSNNLIEAAARIEALRRGGRRATAAEKQQYLFGFRDGGCNSIYWIYCSFAPFRRLFSSTPRDCGIIIL